MTDYEKLEVDRTNITDSSSSALPTIRVSAPANLPAGYTFEVQVPSGGDLVPIEVTVPAGGVNAGDIFLAPRPAGIVGEKVINAPTGKWKDGLFEFFKYGKFHPHLCCSFWCTQIAMGQVMQRMKLTWLGHIGENTTNTFQIVLTFTLAFIIFIMSINVYIESYSQDGNFQDIPKIIFYLHDIATYIFIIWSVYALSKTRQNVRETYQIPGTQQEDCLLSFWCSCCVVGQLARHTGDFETYESRCLEPTGLPKNAPMNV